MGNSLFPLLSYRAMDLAPGFTEMLALNQVETTHFGAQHPITHTLRSMHAAEKVFRKQYSKYVFSRES